MENTFPEDLECCFVADCKLIKIRARDKRPTDNGWRKRCYDPMEIREHVQKGGNAGWRLGPEDLVLDVDPRNFSEGDDPLARLCEELDLDLSSFPHVLTGSGGHHYYMKKPCDLDIVERLSEYPGIEFKTNGRQVVVPGSVHPSGTRYLWDDFAPPPRARPQAPQSLLNKIQRTHLITTTEEPPYSPKQLAELLGQLDPSLYRDHKEWFDIMCASHDATGGRGLREFIAWSTSDPPYRTHGRKIENRWNSLEKDPPPNRITYRTLIQHVLRVGGAIPGERPQDDFSLVVDSVVRPKRFLTLDELKNLPPASWLIKGFIPEGSFGIWYGEPGTFKSFLALHASLCLANGNEFFGRMVHQGDVFFLAGESAAGFRPRTMAWEQHFGFPNAHPPFHIQIGGAALNQPGEVQRLARDILAISENPKLIVIDTAQVYLSGNENSPDDMGSFVRACLVLRDTTSASVLAIHHQGKDGSKGARGHTSLNGAADFIYKTIKKETIVEVVCEKMKEASDRVRLFLEPQLVTVDPDGEFPDSLVLMETEQPGNDETTSILRLAKKFDGQGQKKFLETVKDVLQISGAYNKIKKAIPEGKDNALSFEDGLLWIEPDPGNTRGEKLIRYEQDFEETDVGISDLLA